MSDPTGMAGRTPDLDALRHGALDVQGRLVEASNATLLCRLESGPECVYKPVAGERPLWDFPAGTLAAREVAAYVVSEAASWHVVPPTVLRDGPYGPGMCQLWVDDTGERLVDVVPPGRVPAGWFSVLDGLDTIGEPVRLVHADDERLRRLAVFDLVINNADRKGGHVLMRADGSVYGVDHGVSLHVDDKLRTVLWGWAGARLSDAEVAELRKLRSTIEGETAGTLRDLLREDEVEAVCARLDELLSDPVFPTAQGRLNPVPWPAF